MARTARIVIPDVHHHVTQRGNNRQDVFFVVFFAYDDLNVYLRRLAEEAAAAHKAKRPRAVLQPRSLTQH